jgi:hypothetical protein
MDGRQGRSPVFTSPFARLSPRIRTSAKKGEKPGRNGLQEFEKARGDVWLGDVRITTAKPGGAGFSDSGMGTLSRRRRGFIISDVGRQSVSAGVRALKRGRIRIGAGDGQSPHAVPHGGIQNDFACSPIGTTVTPIIPRPSIRRSSGTPDRSEGAGDTMLRWRNSVRASIIALLWSSDARSVFAALPTGPIRSSQQLRRQIINKADCFANPGDPNGVGDH